MKQIDVECDDHVATHYGMHIRVYVRIVIPVFWANKCTKFALNTYRFFPKQHDDYPAAAVSQPDPSDK